VRYSASASVVVGISRAAWAGPSAWGIFRRGAQSKRARDRADKRFAEKLDNVEHGSRAGLFEIANAVR